MIDRLAQTGDPVRDLLVDVEKERAEVQHDHGAVVARLVTQLLHDIDAVHRAGMAHLVQAVRALAGEALIKRLVADPAIRVPLTSDDLIAIDRRLRAEGAEPGTEGPRVRVAVIPAETLHRIHRPVYHVVTGAWALRDGDTMPLEIDGYPVLLARVDGTFLAATNRCGSTPLPLQFSRLDGAELVCSWHGCRYDLRTGQRIDHDGERLAVFPVSVEKGVVQIASPVESAAGHVH